MPHNNQIYLYKPKIYQTKYQQKLPTKYIKIYIFKIYIHICLANCPQYGIDIYITPIYILYIYIYIYLYTYTYVYVRNATDFMMKSMRIF